MEAAYDFPSGESILEIPSVSDRSDKSDTTQTFLPQG